MPYENVNLTAIYVALGIGAILVVLALYKKALTIPATISAFVVLVASAVFTGYTGVATFSISFVGAVAVGLVKRQKRKEREEGLYQRQGARCIVQVLANAMPALIYGSIYFATGIHAFLVASVATIVAGVADSFASDLGILSDGKVINILTFKETTRGMSGGVSLLGTMSALTTSAVVATLVFLVGDVGVKGLWITALTGFMGTLIDSVLGASLQGSYRCTVCGKATERRLHCGEPTEKIKGLTCVTNDVVNVLSLMLAGALSIGLYFIK